MNSQPQYHCRQTDLVLGWATNREFKPDSFPGQFPIHFRIRVQPEIHPTPLFLV